MPAETIITPDEKLDQKTDSILNDLFGENLEETSEETTEEETSEETTEEEESTEETTEEESAEVDWEAEDEAPVNETAARKQAKEKGREAKQLKNQLTERELELDAIRAQKQELEERLQLVEAVKLKPEDAPEFQEKHESVMSDVRAVARRLPAKSRTLLTPNFGSIMVSYMETLDVPLEKSEEADLALTEQIVDKLGFSDVPYADLDEDERAAFQPQVDKVMDLLERNLTPTKELQKLHTTLTEKAKVGQLSTGVRQYQAAAAEISPILDAVGDLTDELIEANPHSVESFVARLAKGSPEAKKRLAAAKDDILELLVGPKALTQGEIDKLQANGTDVKEFMRERDRRHADKKKRLAPFLVQALVTRSHFKSTLEKLAKLELGKQSEESEFDALSEVTKGRPSQQAKPKKKGDYLAFLGDEGDD